MRARALLSAIFSVSFSDSNASPRLLHLKKLSERAIAPSIAVSRLNPSLQVVAQAASPTMTIAGALAVDTLHGKHPVIHEIRDANAPQDMDGTH